MAASQDKKTPEAATDQAPEILPPDLSKESADARLEGAAEQFPWMFARRTTTPLDPDPMNPAYARANLDETPATLLAFWFGPPGRPISLKARNRIWFGGGADVDRMIAGRFLDTVARLASGEALRWAMRGPRERLAAIIGLDQFSRSVFRGLPDAFENDALARRLTLDGLARGDDQKLAPLERWFMYMPLEHAEDVRLQRKSVKLFTELAASAPADLRPILTSALGHAKEHAATIRRFGRFPYRNIALGRESTPEEAGWLARRKR
ncbi:MAG: DUF924 family protein [Hyphomonadaceae bacterium]